MNPGFPIRLLVCWPRIPVGCWCLMFKPCQRGLELAPSQVPVPCCGWGCGSMCFVRVTGSACCGYWGFPPGLLCVPTHPHPHLYGARAGAGHIGIEMSVQTGLCWPHVWVCLSLLLVHVPNAGSKSLPLQSQSTPKMLAQLRENKIFPATAPWEGWQLPCAAAGSEVF